MGHPIGPTLRDQLGRLGITGQANSERLARIRIIGSRHREKHERVRFPLARFLRHLEMLDEGWDRPPVLGEVIQRAGQVTAIDQLERRVAGVTRRSTPETAMAHGVNDGAVTARGLAEDAALAFAAATEGL